MLMNKLADPQDRRLSNASVASQVEWKTQTRWREGGAPTPPVMSSPTPLRPGSYRAACDVSFGPKDIVTVLERP